MELVKPEASPCVLVRDGEVRHDGPGVCEVGVFAASLGEEEVEGEGFLVRVKAEGTEEGGVAAGYAFLSSPLPV
jgi:glutathione synthase